MRIKLFSKFFATNTVGIFRRIFIVLLCIWLVAVFFTYSGAWFSDIVTSRGNKITTENQSLRLLATDTAITVYSKDGEPTVAPDFPQTVSDLYADDNSIISLDAYDNDYKRKFLEFNGETGIQNVGANFRQQRALIVSNESDEKLTYTLAFKTQELGVNNLSSAFYFNYTRVGGDIPNRDFHQTSGVELELSDTIDNLGVKIQTIGSKRPIAIQPRSTHVYIVDMGILESAGNSYLNSGLQLDIVLTMSKSAAATYFVEDAESLKNAIEENNGGITLILDNDIKLNKHIKSNEVFNLDLNGFTLELVDDGEIEITFPKRQATMDIGSLQGGQIRGAEAITFMGVNGKSVLNWYPDITGLEEPSSYENVIINSVTIPNYIPPSSKPSSSSDDSSDSSSSDSNNSSSNNSSSNSSNNSSNSSSSNSGNNSSNNSTSDLTSNSSENSSNNSSEDSGNNSINNSSDSSNDNSENSGLDGYTDYDDIRIAEDYNGGNGTAESPYLINSVRQFKAFIEDTGWDKSVFYQLQATISHIKNIPAYALKKSAVLVFEQDCKLEYLDFDAVTPSITPENPFKSVSFYTVDGYMSSYSNHLFNVSYRGGEVY